MEVVLPRVGILVTNTTLGRDSNTTLGRDSNTILGRDNSTNSGRDNSTTSGRQGRGSSTSTSGRGGSTTSVYQPRVGMPACGLALTLIKRVNPFAFSYINVF